MPPRMRARAASISASVSTSNAIRPERQDDAGLDRGEHAAELALDARKSLRVIGLEAQHDDRRGVRCAGEAEAVGIFDTQPVDADDGDGAREIRLVAQPRDQRMLLAFVAGNLQLD